MKMKFIHRPQICDSRQIPQKPKRKRRHIPHKLRPKEAVKKRNERERRRVNDVNGAFVELQKHLPSQNSKKRVSKIKILQNAITYIYELMDILDADKGLGQEISFDVKAVWQKGPFTDTSSDRSTLNSMDTTSKEMYTDFIMHVRLFNFHLQIQISLFSIDFKTKKS